MAGDAARSTPPAPAPRDPVNAPVVEGLLAMLRDLHTDERQCLEGYFPPLIEGAADELRARGRRVTADSLADVLTAEGTEGWGGWALCALRDALHEMKLTRNGLNALAHAEGRQAVRRALDGWSDRDGE